MTIRSPKACYATHKYNAGKRGLSFTLTFEQWWAIWEPHWDKRGVGAHQMCMCRYRDEGGYDLGNVRIATKKENAQEASVARRVRRAQAPKRRRETRITAVAGQVEWIGNRGFDEYSEDDG